jgi:hypothetical protein
MFNSKYFSKIIYLFLSVLFIYNSFGYLVLYFPARTIIKHTVFKSIEKKEIAPEDLSVLAFNINDLKAKKYDFKWEKPGKEFRFNGKMYDIEAEEIKDDSIYFNCYYDHKENLIEEMFTIHFSDHKKDKTQNSIQRVILIGLYSEEIKNYNSKLQNRNVTNIPLQKTEAGLLNPINDVPTPPPRIIV